MSGIEKNVFQWLGFGVGTALNGLQRIWDGPAPAPSPKNPRIVTSSSISEAHVKAETLPAVRWVAQKACTHAAGLLGRFPTDLELSVGFICFVRWLNESNYLLREGDPSQLYYPSDSAREAALLFIAQIADNPNVVGAIRIECPSFKPIDELSWGSSKANHQAWQSCFTRAIIMWCRSFAYSYSTLAGFNQTPVNTDDQFLAFGGVIQKLPDGELGNIALVWITETLGSEAMESPGSQ